MSTQNGSGIVCGRECLFYTACGKCNYENTRDASAPYVNVRRGQDCIYPEANGDAEISFSSTVRTSRRFGSFTSNGFFGLKSPAKKVSHKPRN